MRRRRAIARLKVDPMNQYPTLDFSYILKLGRKGLGAGFAHGQGADGDPSHIVIIAGDDFERITLVKVVAVWRLIIGLVNLDHRIRGGDATRRSAGVNPRRVVNGL